MGFETARELGAKKLTLITWYQEAEETKAGIRVHYIPLWKWLLKNRNR
jgi:predicted AAA+ superfamily ATPase